MIFFIIFFTTALVNYCGSNCCCKCCCNLRQDREIKATKKNYFIPPKIDRNKRLLDFPNIDERKFRKADYFLNSGISYKVPLNMIWANNNCAILSIIRLLLSEPHFSDVLLNKGKVDIEKIRDPRRRKRIEEILKKKAKDIELDEIRNNVSKVIRGVLSGEHKDYNNFFNWVSEILGVDRRECDTVFMSFINIYFENDFESYISDRIYVNDPILNTLDFVYCRFSETIGEISTGDYLYVQCRELKNRMVLGEKIEIKQFPSCEIYKYELIGAIFVCGELKNVKNVCSSDFACVVPVYDSNRNKLGYVKYQFNDVSDVKPLTYWNNVDNFGKWENPRPYLAIYRLKEKDMKLEILNK